MKRFFKKKCNEQISNQNIIPGGIYKTNLGHEDTDMLPNQINRPNLINWPFIEPHLCPEINRMVGVYNFGGAANLPC